VNSHLSSTGVFLGSEHGRHASCGKGPRRVAITAILLVWAWGLCASGLAKEKKPVTRTVSGVVLDEAENGIEGATVELADVQTGKLVAVYSQEGGQYHFSDLLPSHDYKIKATFKGSSSEGRQISSIDTRMRVVINLTIPGPKH
jgi:hypothetical protein